MPSITKDQYDTWGHQLLCVAREIVTHDGHLIKYDQKTQAWYAYPALDTNGVGGHGLKDGGSLRKFSSAGKAYRACCASKADLPF